MKKLLAMKQQSSGAYLVGNEVSVTMEKRMKNRSIRRSRTKRRKSTMRTSKLLVCHVGKKPQ